jgi:hypothetical protein
MNSKNKRGPLAALLLVVGLFGATGEAAANPYAAETSREIKSLSSADIAGLLAGKGAGLAKAAELNGYPGPAHVLELAGPLMLDPNQLLATRNLMTAHRERAGRLGAELLASELTLDRLFSERRVDADSVDQATRQVGNIASAVARRAPEDSPAPDGAAERRAGSSIQRFARLCER